MKRIFYGIGLATVLVLLTAASGLSENGQAVYNQYKKVEKKMEKALGNVVMTLTIESEGNLTETTVYLKGKKSRMESVVIKSTHPMMGKSGDKTIVIDDGVTRTLFSPQFGKNSHPSDTDDSEEEAPQSVTYLGKEKIEGMTCDKINVTRPYGETETLWISVKGNTLVKEKSTNDGDTTLTLNSDFKKVKGFLLPHVTQTFEDGVLSGATTLSRIETGARLKESLFDTSKVKGYAKNSAPVNASQAINPALMMGRMMEMGMEIERLNREGKTAEAKALEKQLKAMAAGLDVPQ
ncbi:DUF4412 domain-containing protein [Desulfoluna sp.]|uniref:DUF4412 domain-containing protein n=1 Tax=Desulfoluna sp. TaxID=2045199 RepID=UPI0026367DAE|nr:DUF4412 domain-containing protein [Desulfoluna sp.]